MSGYLEESINPSTSQSSEAIGEVRIDDHSTFLKRESFYQTSRRQREEYQALIQDRFKVPVKSLRQCRKAPIAFGNGATISYNLNKGRGRWSGLHMCRNISACPICSGKRRHQKAIELQDVIDKHTSNNGSVYSINLTIDDFGFKTIKEGLDLLTSSWNKLISGRRGNTLKEKYGFDGYFRAMEVTFNLDKKSFHPHLHGLLTFSKKLSQYESDCLGHLLLTAWCKVVEGQSNGDNKPYLTLQHFAEVYNRNLTKDYGHDVSRYLLKVTNGFSNEVTSNWKKEGRTQSSFGLWEMCDYALTLDEESRDFQQIKWMFNQFVEAGKGKRWFSNSRTMFSRYSVDEKDEEEIFSDEDEETEDVIVDIEVIQPVFAALQNYKQLSNIITAVEQQEEAFSDFIDLLGRCEVYEAKLWADYRVDTINLSKLVAEGHDIAEAFDIDRERVKYSAERYADAEIYTWVREHIQRKGTIQVRWFRDFHAAREDVFTKGSIH